MSAAEADVRTISVICNFLEDEGMLSQPCSFKGARTVTMVINMSVTEARSFCQGFPEVLQQLNLGKLEGWTLNVRSPVSGDNNIAFCRL